MLATAGSNLCAIVRPEKDTLSHSFLHPKPVTIIETNSMPRRRPFGVTLLLWLVLSLSAWGLVRLLATLRWWEVLSEFQARLSPLYLSITGAGWALCGRRSAVEYSSAHRPGRAMAISISVSLFLAEYWIERIVFEGPARQSSFCIVRIRFVINGDSGQRVQSKDKKLFHKK